MESLIGFGSAITAAIRLLCVSIGFFAFVTGIYLFASARPFLRKVRLACPVTGNPTPVLLRINTLKDPQKPGEGVDVVRCPEFGFGEILCPKGCVFNSAAQRIHQMKRERRFKENGIFVF